MSIIGTEQPTASSHTTTEMTTVTIKWVYIGTGSGAGMCVIVVVAVLICKFKRRKGMKGIYAWEINGVSPGYRSGDLSSYDTPVWKVSGSGPGCQSGYRGGDL